MTSSRTALVGIDWGTTNRRAYALNADGVCTAEIADDQGMLAAQGRFEAALGDALTRLPGVDADTVIVMSGMVGAAQGWREAPYLDTQVPLDQLGQHLIQVDAPTLKRTAAIAPGYRWRGEAGAIDVMRGEETQLLGAIALGQRDGWFVLPGTHSKWVELKAGRITRFFTYMTGELFALLSAHGTLSSLMREHSESPSAFEAGFRAASQQALSNALFSCRARVVGGAMPSGEAHSFLSGLLIGVEWHDRIRAQATDAPKTVTLIGSPALAAHYAKAGALLGVEVRALDPRRAYLAALAQLVPSSAKQ